jgi:hypothetical protein
MPAHAPILTPTQHHPLQMPIAMSVVPKVHQAEPIQDTVTDAFVLIIDNTTAIKQTKPSHIIKPMAIEMTNINLPHRTDSAINKMHMPLPLPNLVDTKDRGKLAKMQIANERRRQRAVMEAHAEQERRADDPNIFNNNVYEPNTKTLVVHERRTKSHQQKRTSDQL